MPDIYFYSHKFDPLPEHHAAYVAEETLGVKTNSGHGSEHGKL